MTQSQHFTRKILIILCTYYNLDLISPTNADPITNPIRIGIVTAEQTGYFNTGGLGHAVRGKAWSLNEDPDIEVEVLMPYYESIRQDTQAQPHIRETPLEIIVSLDFRDGVAHKHSRFRVHEGNIPGTVRTLLYSHEARYESEPDYFWNVASKKKGYGPADIKGEAFGAWAKAVAETALLRQYDILILSDWHAGFVAPFIQDQRLAGRQTPKMILDVHNAGYEEWFPVSLAEFLGINNMYMTHDGLLHKGGLSPLKAGMEYSDMMFMVSLNYAQETESPRFADELSGLVWKKRLYHRVSGWINGIHVPDWDPQVVDTDLPFTFSVDDMSGRAHGKLAMQRHFGLPVNGHIPVIGLTSRVTEQKGFDYMFSVLDQILAERSVQVVIVGDADQVKYEEGLDFLKLKYPEQFRVRGFSAKDEKWITRYGDFLANFSVYEPSGLNFQFGMATGNIPLVSRVGGQADLVRDGVNGFLAEIVPASDPRYTNQHATRESVLNTMRRALDTYENDRQKISDMQKTAMKMDNSWKSRLSQFKALFEYVVSEGPMRLTQAQSGAPVGRSAVDLMRASRKLSSSCSAYMGRQSK